MKKSLNILAFGAHPDDCDLVFGGTAMKLAKAGHRVKFVSVTNGDTGHHIMGGGQLVRRRYDEVQQAAKLAGLYEYEVFDIHNNGLTADIATREKIIKTIREFEADIVLTHRTVDYHPDHRATAHKEVMPEKRRNFPPFGVKNARNTQSISALFALTGENLAVFGCKAVLKW